MLWTEDELAWMRDMRMQAMPNTIDLLALDTAVDPVDGSVTSAGSKVRRLRQERGWLHSKSVRIVDPTGAVIVVDEVLLDMPYGTDLTNVDRYRLTGTQEQYEKVSDNEPGSVRLARSLRLQRAKILPDYGDE